MPGDADDQLSSFEAAQQFEQEVHVIRRRVRQLAAKHYLGEASDADPWFAFLTQQDPDDVSLGNELLQHYGFIDTVACIAHLRDLTTNHFLLFPLGVPNEI